MTHKDKVSMLITGGLLASLVVVGFYNTPERTVGEIPTPRTVGYEKKDYQEELKGQDLPALEEDRSGYWITISSIDIDQKMIKTSVSGNRINVPSTGIAYLQYTSGNTFIMAHKEGDFRDLYKKPSKIILSLNRQDKVYYLRRAEQRKATDINMDQVLSYQGVVLMTCAGEKVEDTYVDRLILYYK